MERRAKRSTKAKRTARASTHRAKTEAWLLGPYRPNRSSWVGYAGYAVSGRQSGVTVSYKDKKGQKTVTCLYPDTDGGDYQDFKNAKSKGKYVHKFLYDLDYIIVDL
jgi:hypothetical protein